MELFELQIILSLCLSVMTIIIGLLPVTLLRALTKNAQQNRKISWVLTLLSCFAGGVILATCFLDILPHANHNYAKYRHDYKWKTTFPLPEFFACIGFFFIYFFEEIVIRLFASGQQFHGHSHGAFKFKDEEAQEPLKDKDTSNGKLNDDASHRKISMNTHEIIMDECARNLSSEDNGNTSFIKSVTFALAMSSHSVLEGFALGVQENTTAALTLFCSLLVDNAIDAFTVGLQVSRSGSKKLYLLVSTVVVYGLFFNGIGFMSPFGAMIGNSNFDPQWKDLAIVLLESVAGGVFLFMIFLEILAHERENDHSNLVQLGAIIVGFTFIASLQVNEHFGEGGGHGHH